MTKADPKKPASEKFVRDQIKELDKKISKKLDSKLNGKMDKKDGRKLEDKIGGLEVKVIGLEVDMQIVKKDIKDLKSNLDIKFDKVITQLDGLAGQFRKFDDELPIVSHKLSEHNDRIEKLEETVFSSP